MSGGHRASACRRPRRWSSGRSPAAGSDDCVVIVEESERGRGPLRQQHDDHQRRRAGTAGSPSIALPPRRRRGVAAGRGAAGAATSTSRSWSRAAERRRGRGVAAGRGRLPLVARRASADPSDFAEPPGDTDLSVLGRRARSGLAGGVRPGPAADRVLAGFAEHRDATTVYLGHARPGSAGATSSRPGALHLVARSDRRQRLGLGRRRAPADFADVTIEAPRGPPGRAARLGRSGGSSCPAGRYEVVLPPEAVADLMVDLVDGGQRPGRRGRQDGLLPARAAAPGWASRCQRSRSTCAATRPSPGSSARRSSRRRGVGRRRVGVRQRAAAGRARAGSRAAASPASATTGPARPARVRPGRRPIDNLVLELPGAAGTPEDLVARTERGLLLTCLWYIREVDPATLLLTGLTRDGVYLVEDGEVVGAVNNFRFNESPVDLLARATEAGAHRADPRPRVRRVGRTGPACRRCGSPTST